MKSSKGKGLLSLLALVLVSGFSAILGMRRLCCSKLVTDENGVTSQEGRH